MAQVTGSNGDCSIPSTTTAAVLNVTAVGPVGDGFVTVWPADAPRPNTSNLNFSDGQSPVANAVTVKLGGGAIRLVSSASQVDVIADVVGYFEDHDHDDAYKPLGSVLGTSVVNTSTTARAGVSTTATTARPTTTTIAATTTTRAATTTTAPATTTTTAAATTTTAPATTTTSTSVSTGIDVPASGTAVQNGNALRAYLGGVVAPRIVRLSAGSFDIGDTPLTVPAGVTLRGAGVSSTSISGQSPPALFRPIVTLANNATISDLAVRGLSGGAAIQANGNATVFNVNIAVGQTIGTNGAFYNAGSGLVTLDNVTARSFYGVNNGSYNGDETGTIRITNSDIDGVVQNAGGGTITVQNSKIGQNTLSPESGATAYFNGLIQLTDVQVYSASVGVYPVDSGSRIEVTRGRIFSLWPRQAAQTGTATCTAVLNPSGSANLSASCN